MATFGIKENGEIRHGESTQMFIIRSFNHSRSMEG
jgi:hypothetical protein